MKKPLFYLSLLILSACSEQEELVNISSKPDVFKIIEAEQKIQNLNSVAFCVVKNSEVLWADAIGKADKEKNIPATTETRYLVASISKTVTAVASMQLFEQGLLDLDADVNQYLPFSVRNPRFPNLKITPRMLLSHSSSISDDHIRRFDLATFGFDNPQSLGSYLSDFFIEGRQFYSSTNYYDYAPGEKANYANTGTALLGYIVERISNKDFSTYCKENIFLPLGMTKSEFSLKNTPLDELAIPYSPFSLGAPKSPHYSQPDIPAGGLRTTINDLARFQRALILNGTFNGFRMLRPSSLALMKTAVYPFQRGRLNVSQGLGMYYRKIGNLTLLGHGGGDMGITSDMLYDPNTNVGVIVFTNTTSIVNIDLIVNSLIQFGNKQ